MKKTNLFKLVAACFAIILFNNSVQAQGEAKYGNDSVSCVQNISLYREFYKQKNYKEAFPAWRKVFLNCPASTEYMYVDGPAMIKTKIAEEKDKAKQAKLVDTLMMVYDQRIKYFNKEGYVLGRKGVDMIRYTPEKTQETYDVLKKAYSLEGIKLEAAAADAYFQSVLTLLKEGKTTKDEALDVYDKVSEVVAAGLAKTPGDKYYTSAQENIEARFIEIADCASLVNMYGPKLSTNPNDVELLKKITKMLDKRSCENEQLYLEAAVNLDKLEPSADSKGKIAKMYLAKGNASEAAKFYTQAIEMESDNNNKATYYLELALAYQKSGQFSNSRNAALKAVSNRPGWGKPYILIGDLYVASAKECGENEFQQKAVYWAAVDKYQQAKSTDPSIASEANSKIATYAKYFPQKNDAFFYSVNDGDSYTVGCWINETTKARTQ